MDEEYRKLLLKQHYRIYNDHAAVKLCGWMKQALLHGRNCYKQDFYGIETHRCLQMTPSFNQCTHLCPFCWRTEGHDFKVDDWAEPEDMLDALIAYQRELLCGFKGDPRCSREMWEETWNPNQVAISLAGEPTEYPYLSEFIGVCKSRGMTTFLVTNGTLPERIEALKNLPSELYVTVAASDEETYRKACRPKIPDGWERIMRTLDLLPTLKTRTVVRHTLVKGINLKDPEGYARLDNRAEPDFVEAKGYVFVGGSRQRLSLKEMPTHEEIVGFADELAPMVGMERLNEKTDSRVVLLGHPGVETDIRKALEEGGGVPRSPRIDKLLTQRTR